ncbi:MAG: DUF3107 domain-containing protein [Cellulomonadaceae bacterium]|jgi:hypothetical protein|nr:DUF3107 domain-containing protein [Cellulomonadaceae bacterium]
MEITIGVQNSPREVSIDTDQTAEAVTTAVTVALADNTVLDLTDSRGRRVLVPAATIAYIELGPEEKRTVGFGSL